VSGRSDRALGPAGPDVLIVGAGPAGLSAAAELRRLGVAPVLVVDREREPGGIPRHCHHGGFGLQDLRRSMSGPAYARRLARVAADGGARLSLETTVTGIDPTGVVSLVSPSGPAELRPLVVLLATGARERPRPARLVPGDRPAGVFTTGQLQQWVHVHHLPVGRRAVVVGAEHVSFSAALTLREAGVETAAIVTDLPRHQMLGAFALANRALLRIPLITSTEVVAVRGRGRVSAVELADRISGRRRTIEVDTVVFTGDWVPDHELARRAGTRMDPATKGPLTDGGGQSSVIGIVAAGNLVHPAETAGVAALGGRRVAQRLAGRLDRGDLGRAFDGVEVQVDEPLAWTWPGIVRPDDIPDRILLRTRAFTGRRTVSVEQAGRVLGRARLRHATPNRSLSIPGGWVADVDVLAGPVVLRLV
jgi:NADPH-dependent 2,4-dienoyl-CoA reductase/sulfur reductase-like enzyme